jgi:nucleoside-diphosphate-sugar epimerase
MATLSFHPDYAEILRTTTTPIIVTGAGGWLGQAALEMFEAALGDALPARLIAFGATAREMTLRSGRKLPLHALRDLLNFSAPAPIFFHFAYLTREHASTQPVEAYIAANRDISALVQHFLGRNGCAGLFVPSSGAVYAGRDLAQNPYGVLKRDDEAGFATLAQRLDAPAVLARVFNLAGPFINKLDSYALACILLDILGGGPVSLRAAHPVWRAYADVGDVLNIALGCLLTGATPPVFDTTGEPVELSALAQRAGRLLTGNAPEILRPDWAQGPAERYLGCGESYGAIAKTLGLSLHDLDQQIIDTAAYLRASKRPGL